MKINDSEWKYFWNIAYLHFVFIFWIWVHCKCWILCDKSLPCVENLKFQQWVCGVAKGGRVEWCWLLGQHWQCLANAGNTGGKIVAVAGNQPLAWLPSTGRLVVQLVLGRRGSSSNSATQLHAGTAPSMTWAEFGDSHHQGPY